MKYKNKAQSSASSEVIHELPISNNIPNKKLGKSARIVGATVVSLLVPSGVLALSYSESDKKTQEITLDTVVSDPNQDTTIPESTTTTSVDTTIPESTTTTSVDTTITESTTTNPEITLQPILQGIKTAFRKFGAGDTVMPYQPVSYQLDVHNPDYVPRTIRVATGFERGENIVSITNLQVTGCGEYSISKTMGFSIANITLQEDQVCSISYEVKALDSYNARIVVYDDSADGKVKRHSAGFVNVDLSGGSTTTIETPTTLNTAG